MYVARPEQVADFGLPMIHVDPPPVQTRGSFLPLDRLINLIPSEIK